MNESNPIGESEQHGGNLSWLAARWPDAPTPFIDLSTGVNPYGYKLPQADSGWMAHLPDITQVLSLRQAMAQYYGPLDVGQVAVAAGMQPLVGALAALRMREYGASRVAIVSPTYKEHERVWLAVGHECHGVATVEEAMDYDVVVVVNPNNPDGVRHEPEKLLSLAVELDIRNGWLIVDESFADVAPEVSVAKQVVLHENMVVLRSLGKFFGVPGLRVSAAIAPEPCAAWLREVMGPWPVPTFACEQLPVMLRDGDWIGHMRLMLEDEAYYWRKILARSFTVVGYTPLFTLVESMQAMEWHAWLASQGILVRRFDYAPHWLRFGLPDAAFIPRLKTALEGFK